MSKPQDPNSPNIVRHIAIIPDGNRRWARERKLAPWMGHFHGLKGLEKLLEHALATNVEHISFWGASVDNVKKRDHKEVVFLMEIFRKEFNKLAKSKLVHQNQVKINVIGDWAKLFPKETVQAIKLAIDSTKNYKNRFANFFLGYSGTKEMTDAISKLAKKYSKNTKLKIDREELKRNLLTKDLPPVDLLVRTGGEPHNSDGFMMWETTDSQYIFLEKYWPDFTPQDFDDCIQEYSNRQRRFGA